MVALELSNSLALPELGNSRVSVFWFPMAIVISQGNEHKEQENHPNRETPIVMRPSFLLGHEVCSNLLNLSSKLPQV